MAYSAKNEVVFQIGTERPITLRPSFAALDAIEQRTGKTIIDLAQLVKGGMSIQNLKTILNEGSKAAGNEIKDGEINRLLEDYGIGQVTWSLGEFFARALYGGSAGEQLAKKNQSEVATTDQPSS